MPDTVFHVVLVGAGATLAMDAWGLLLRRVYGVTGLDYRLVGRWLGHMPRGRFRHDGIGRAAPVTGELLLGWAAHYAIGIAFAAGLVGIRGAGWLAAPTLTPALLAGLVTVALPYFVMQPAFGMGIASSRMPDPTAARLRSLVTHLVFGVGLYLAARLMAALWLALSNLKGYSDDLPAFRPGRVRFRALGPDVVHRLGHRHPARRRSGRHIFQPVDRRLAGIMACGLSGCADCGATGASRRRSVGEGLKRNREIAPNFLDEYA